jgi:hypothetical protein
MPLNDSLLRKTYSVNIGPDEVLELIFISPTLDAEDNLRRAELFSLDTHKIIDQAPDKYFKVLVDLSPLGKAGRITPKARKVYAQVMAVPQLKKIAFVGANTFLRVMVGFLAKAARIEKIFGWFSDINEARAWLAKD